MTEEKSIWLDYLMVSEERIVKEFYDNQFEIVAHVFQKYIPGDSIIERCTINTYFRSGLVYSHTNNDGEIILKEGEEKEYGIFLHYKGIDKPELTCSFIHNEKELKYWKASIPFEELIGKDKSSVARSIMYGEIFTKYFEISGEE